MNQLGWSNIPHCITKAINTILEKQNSNCSEIDDLKNSLSDLIIKFQVKTSRLDSTLQELSLSFKSSLPALTEEINILKVKTDTIISNFDSKLKPVNETLNDLKLKVGSISSDLKKEGREFANKLEKLRYDQNCLLEENIDRVVDKVHSNDVNVQKKMQSIGYRIDNDFESLTKSLEIVRNDIAVNGVKIIEQAELINIQFNTCRGLGEKVQSVMDSLKGIEKEQEDTGVMLQSLIRPTPTANTVEKKKTVPKDMIINPIFERIGEVEEKLEENVNSLKDLISLYEQQQINTIKSTKNSIENWTVDQINSIVNNQFLKLKEKLEWLPDSSYSLKNMGITEARLFLIESRIRSEEKQRILNDQQILELLSSHKLKTEPKVFESHRRGSLSPRPNKNSFLNLDKKTSSTQNGKKYRPSSSYQYRDAGSQDKLKDRLLIKV